MVGVKESSHFLIAVLIRFDFAQVKIRVSFETWHKLQGLTLVQPSKSSTAGIHTLCSAVEKFRGFIGTSSPMRRPRNPANHAVPLPKKQLKNKPLTALTKLLTVVPFKLQRICCDLLKLLFWSLSDIWGPFKFQKQFEKI